MSRLKLRKRKRRKKKRKIKIKRAKNEENLFQVMAVLQMKVTLRVQVTMTEERGDGKQKIKNIEMMIRNILDSNLNKCFIIKKFYILPQTFIRQTLVKFPVKTPSLYVK